MFEIGNSDLVRPLSTYTTGCYGHVGPLGKDEKPHLCPNACVRKLADSLSKSPLVCLPTTGQENPRKDLRPRTNDRNFAERVFQDDV